MTKMTCCGLEAVWVENVPGKGYNFCQECRKEVLSPEVVKRGLEAWLPDPFEDADWVEKTLGRRR